MNYNKIIKATPSVIVGSYDVENYRYTRFFILNDSSNNPIAGLAVILIHHLADHSRTVNVHAIARDGETLLGICDNWSEAVDTILGKSVEKLPHSFMEGWKLEKCPPRIGENPFDNFINGKLVTKEIGPHCRQDTARILNALNIAWTNNHDEVTPAMLRGIGKRSGPQAGI